MRGGVENVDYEQLTNNGYLFARKFDEKVNMDIVNRICEYVKEMEEYGLK